MADTQTQPVFINQTADYQEAAKKVSELANYQAPLAAAAQELGLSVELQQTKDALNNLKGQAQVLEASDQRLAVQRAQIDADSKRTSHRISEANTIVSTSTGVIAGLAAAQKAKSWKLLKAFGGAVAGALAGMLATIGIGNFISAGSYERKKENEKSQVLNKLDEARATYQALALQNNFMDQMATRMLEQQKALTGEGEDMKLVSTAQVPAVETASPAAPSMAGKYATAPAASNAAAIADQRAEQAAAQAR